MGGNYAASIGLRDTCVCIVRAHNYMKGQAVTDAQRSMDATHALRRTRWHRVLAQA